MSRAVPWNFGLARLSRASRLYGTTGLTLNLETAQARNCPSWA